ncbi:putative HTH transcriptional regulator [Desulfitispora alkaliphila]|uniref:winged helix-turn-helix domain-containing protein n=1 Tax=Desulfitispora alkaliphila TaxID=622674 RepID=UPI003D207706
MQKCHQCGDLVDKEDIRTHGGKEICEDCYIEVIQPPKTCDVAAVHAAKKHREMMGQTGTDGLTEVQKRIYEYVKENEKATAAELASALDLSPAEVQKNFSVLRHCELLKGSKEGNTVYFVLF